MAIVHELGYVPNPVARTLTTKRLGALGLLLPQASAEALRNPYLWEVIRGIGEACETGEFSLVILPPIQGRIIEAARRAFVDGLVTIGVGPGHEVVELLNRLRIPFVTIDGAAAESTVNIGIDDEAAAYALMRYVLGLGHRRIAILPLKPETLNLPEKRFSLVSNRRLAGFSRALSEYNLDLESPGVQTVPVECSLDGGQQAALRLLHGGEAPTAILALADAVAFGVYEACRTLGFSIPGDLSVTGFDDLASASLAFPPLTTVRQPGSEKGRVAASLVIEILEGRPAAPRILETELVIRGSTATPRTGTLGLSPGNGEL